MNIVVNIHDGGVLLRTEIHQIRNGTLASFLNKDFLLSMYVKERK